MNKNKNMKMSNENTNGKDIADQSQARDRLHNPSPNPIPTRNYEPFDFEINQEFIEQNKGLNLNLVRHGQNHKQKFAPFTRSHRRKRRNSDTALDILFPLRGAEAKECHERMESIQGSRG